MNERMERVLQKMEKKGIDQLLVSDPLSIRFLTGIMVNPGERLYALLLRTSGKHTIFLNYLYYVSNTGFEEVWFSDMDDQIGVLTRHIDTKGVLGIDKVFPARFLIPLQERCPELKTVWGSDCVYRSQAHFRTLACHGAGIPARGRYPEHDGRSRYRGAHQTVRNRADPDFPELLPDERNRDAGETGRGFGFAFCFGGKMKE